MRTTADLISSALTSGLAPTSQTRAWMHPLWEHTCSGLIASSCLFCCLLSSMPADGSWLLGALASVCCMHAQHHVLHGLISIVHDPAWPDMAQVLCLCACIPLMAG